MRNPLASHAAQFEHDGRLLSKCHVSGQVLSQHTAHICAAPTPCQLLEHDGRLLSKCHVSGSYSQSTPRTYVLQQLRVSSFNCQLAPLHVRSEASDELVDPTYWIDVSQTDELVELEQVCRVSRVPAAQHDEELLQARARPQPRQCQGLVAAANAGSLDLDSSVAVWRLRKLLRLLRY
jgi:hypothetical protein